VVAAIAAAVDAGAGCFPPPDTLVTEEPPTSVDAAAPDGNAAFGDAPDRAGPPDTVALPDVVGTNCEAFAQVWCARAEECEPFTQRIAGLTPENCAARLGLWCHFAMADPRDTSWTPAAFRGCIRHLSEVTCDDWRLTTDNLKGQQCIVAGTRPTGAGCATGSQCQSHRCVRFDECGLCGQRSLNDGPCTGDLDCVPGLFCWGQRCKSPQPVGATCDDNSPCHPALQCAAGRCAPPGGAGAPCTSNAHCDSERFLLCNRSAGACGTARPGAVADSLKPDGTVDYCAEGNTARSGACLPRARDGEACVTSGDGPRCLYGSSCEVPAGEAYGKCVPLAYRECPAVRPPPPAGGYPPGMDPWCRNPAFPTFCPASGQQAPGCWDSGTDCSTIISCNDTRRACSRPGMVVDCQTRKCVPVCAPVPGATSCDACALARCCDLSTICGADPMCSASHAGPNWAALQTCRATFCTKECQ
jgi:hypothetical protein